MTADSKINELQVWKKLQQHAESMRQPENHLSKLIEMSNRLENFSIKGGGLFFDFSRQAIDEQGIALLLELAEKRGVSRSFHAMTEGAIMNRTEQRAALHTAARSFSGNAITVNGKDVMPKIRAVREKVRLFSDKVHAGEIAGKGGQPFRDIVVIGIGGSCLGAEFVSRALSFYADKGKRLHFLSNVDIHNFGEIAGQIDPAATLWVIISKSYTTAETTANTKLAYAYMQANGIPPEKHVVTVTSKGSPGDDPGNPVLESFHMFDFIGGRYSVTSAVGAVPLSLFLGYDRFEAFLKGAEEMDIHAKTALPDRNLPLMSALLSIWNNNFLNYGACGIIPYASPLCKLAPHVQQLYMESNGKSVTAEGKEVDVNTGVIIFGEPGTNAQHSFFQLAHQGRCFPIDFIGVVNPLYQGGEYDTHSKGVTNHQELWANLMSQPTALAVGRGHNDKARSFSGNRPSSTILMENLSPTNVGRLLSFYEARTVFEAFVWGINPFDQFGVELGKQLASGIRKSIAAKNENQDFHFNTGSSLDQFYLETLFSGEI